MRQGFHTYKPYYLSTLALAGPVVISQLGHMLVQTADSIVVGHFAGTIPLAAVSLVHSVFMIVLVIGLGIAYGLTPLIAQENGRKNHAECGTLLSNSLWINTLSGILLFCLVYFGSMAVIDHLDQDPAVVREAKPYLFILGLSIVPMMVFNAFKQFAEGLGFTRQAMNITIWGNVLNILLAIILVRGMFGVAPMGVRGVGYATLTDRCLMALVMGFYVFRSVNFKQYLQRFGIWRADVKRCLAILRIGAPVAMQYVFEVGAFAAAAVVAGTIGANEQAAHQVAITLAATTYMMASGIAAAATIKTGNSYGKRNMMRLRRFAASSYLIVLAFMGFTALVFMIFNRYLPWIFTGDIAVIGVAAQLLVIAGLFQLFDGTQVVGLGILRGMGDVNMPTLITFVAYWVVGLPCAYLLGITFNYGVQGIWYGLTLGLFTSSLLLYMRYRRVVLGLSKDGRNKEQGHP
ncbi:MATE family efflux transporter [Parapedobacter koreensis]|uniref:Multidrug-efflux transporter n=1 Tax=Parapedobacter koreensis TaxID=332977 RepID=A0A1H7LHW2_9SPHI|nr:MATE family efflux transporter [Parapedobacter koreensis]SEK98476.1 multidrug resistance protein, MATE family [Parapedobacter koreensis]